MNDKQRNEWSKVRVKGRARYVLTEGILKWGGMIATAKTFADYLFKYGFTLSKFNEYLSRYEVIFNLLFIWVVFGAIVGYVKWHSSEKDFKRQRGTNP